MNWVKATAPNAATIFRNTPDNLRITKIVIHKAMTRSLRTFWIDENGYCYQSDYDFHNNVHFIATYIKPNHSKGREQLPSAMGFIGCILATVLSFILLGSLGVLVVWMVSWFLYVGHQQRRIVQHIIDQKLCFGCGYSLQGSPATKNNILTCPECATTHHEAEYRRPPKRYKPGNKILKVTCSSKYD